MIQRVCGLGVGVLVLLAAQVPAEENTTESEIRVLLVGDSTVCTYSNPPADRPDLTGWGQVFGEFFDGNVTILNRAVGGQSSKSFLKEGRWDKALQVQPHYVFIQFGHNDCPGKGDRTTDPKTEFRDNLRRYLKESRDVGAQPILVTPVSRRTFINGELVDSLQPYADAMFAIGQEENVPVIDLHDESAALFRKLGDEGSADFNPKPGDLSHFSRKGALEMAKLVVADLPRAAPELAKQLQKQPLSEESVQ